MNAYWNQNLKKYSLLLLPIAALVLWLASLRNIDLRSMSDLGLISILPPLIFAGLGLLTVSFCLTLYRRQYDTLNLVVHVMVLVFMLYGVAPLLEQAPRTPISWKLLGLIDRVIQSGTVNPKSDAFQNWPGFFILMAFITQVLGLKDAMFLSTWAPVILNLLYLLPLLMIYRVASTDKRLVWMAVWFFYLANWIGQDYLSPQGFNYFLFLVIIAILLRWFKHTPKQRDYLPERWVKRAMAVPIVYRINQELNKTRLQDDPSRPWQRAGLLAILIIIFIAIVPSHQLTPFATLAAVGALVIFMRITPRSLPILMAVIAVTWLSFMTVDYLQGHFSTVAAPVGSLTSNVNANLTGRFRGSEDHLFILNLRIFMSFIIWALAAVGAYRRWKTGQIELTFLILALEPFVLLAFQNYGGELLMRVYLFSLPFMALYGASLFYPVRTSGRSVLTSITVGAVSLTLILCFLFSRYGNERMDYFTPQEVEAMQYLYQVAPPGSQILAGTQTLPWRFEKYDTYFYRGVERIARTSDVSSLAAMMYDRKYPESYLVLTRSERISTLLYLGWQPGTWEQFVVSVLESKQFKIIYKNPDAMIVVLNQNNKASQSQNGGK